MACDVIKGKCRAGLVGVRNSTEWNEAELDERLEAVADTAHKSVASVEKLGYGVLDRCSAEERGDELTRAVGLVAAREAAGNEYRLRLAYLLCKEVGATLDALCRVLSSLSWLDV